MGNDQATLRITLDSFPITPAPCAFYGALHIHSEWPSSDPVVRRGRVIVQPWSSLGTYSRMCQQSTSGKNPSHRKITQEREALSIQNKLLPPPSGHAQAETLDMKLGDMFCPTHPVLLNTQPTPSGTLSPGFWTGPPEPSLTELPGSLTDTDGDVRKVCIPRLRHWDCFYFRNIPVRISNHQTWWRPSA